MESLKVYIVDDNNQFRDGLRFYLENILGHTVIGEAANGPEFLEAPGSDQADIVLLDISMPGMNGIEVAQQYLKNKTQRFIAITNLEDQQYVDQMAEVGIKGCVFKKDIHNALSLAMEKVMNACTYFPELLNL